MARLQELMQQASFADGFLDGQPGLRQVGERKVLNPARMLDQGIRLGMPSKIEPERRVDA
ncbi:hypothetical protein ACEUZ9_002739 [Paracoccus litorisediminis]|uniref:Uncharacterized protein n=1 Tax=Paracoccus litorisediminis TaxID=2006130 RepID=A0A844HRQ0_9RHOB|nr:hypothetical protein [Paracoccus litorisediminis]MTH60865.1 hypothetical protein [Paracoccus litorisediminis]